MQPKVNNMFLKLNYLFFKLFSFNPDLLLWNRFSQIGAWTQWNPIRDHQEIQGNGTPFYILDNVNQITGNFRWS